MAIEKIFLLGGLPRSGTTVLGLILDQNPNIFCHVTSPFCEIIWRNYSLWEDQNYREDFIDKDTYGMKIPFLKELTNSYFKNLTSKKYILDKRRNWNNIANIEMYQEIFQTRPKIICPVRPVEDIVASWKSIFKDKEWSDELLQGNVFYNSYYDLKNSFEYGYRDCFHFIEYESLVKNTQYEIKKIYEFLDIKNHKHDLTSIENRQSLKDIDTLILPGLHNIKSSIEKSTTNSKKILTKEEYEKYSKLNFWR